MLSRLEFIMHAKELFFVVSFLALFSHQLRYILYTLYYTILYYTILYYTILTFIFTFISQSYSWSYHSLGNDKVLYETNTQRALKLGDGYALGGESADKDRAKEMKAALQRTSICIGDDREYMWPYICINIWTTISSHLIYYRPCKNCLISYNAYYITLPY